MIKIITGKINSGKTTRLLDFYNKNGFGDGFISKKIMIGKFVYGYNAIKLSDKLEFPLLIHERYYFDNPIIEYKDDEFESIYSIGPYKVLKSGIELIDKNYNFFIDQKITPIFFDEIGKLEINGLGFAKHIIKSIKHNLDIVLTIREDLIEEFIDKFHIYSYEILSR